MNKNNNKQKKGEKSGILAGWGNIMAWNQKAPSAWNSDVSSSAPSLWSGWKDLLAVTAVGGRNRSPPDALMWAKTSDHYGRGLWVFFFIIIYISFYLFGGKCCFRAPRWENCTLLSRKKWLIFFLGRRWKMSEWLKVFDRTSDTKKMNSGRHLAPPMGCVFPQPQIVAYLQQ